MIYVGYFFVIFYNKHIFQYPVSTPYLQKRHIFPPKVWIFFLFLLKSLFLTLLKFNDTSTLVGHFESSPREREKRDRRDSRGDERDGQRRKREMKESEGTEEITTFPSTLTRCKDSRPCPTVSQYQLDTPMTKATGYLCLM